MKRGLWRNTYAATNYKEYWAEGVQSWFNVNKEVLRVDGIHNDINTRRELIKYDPELAKLISKWFNKPRRMRRNSDSLPLSNANGV